MAQAATANIDAGDPTKAVTPSIFIFDALLLAGVDLTPQPKRDRLAAIGKLAHWLEAQTEANFILLSPATSPDENRDLIANQRQQGREGEVWFNPNDPYRGSKDKSGFTTGVRTKHLIEREVVVTGLTPTTAAGRPFGAIEVSEVIEGNLVPRGCVGTGYTLDEMAEIAQRFKTGPLAIVVISQGLTESGQLWLGRFDSIV